jgi:hypothetical protein
MHTTLNFPPWASMFLELFLPVPFACIGVEFLLLVTTWIP